MEWGIWLMYFGAWLKEWAVPLSAGVTFLLALAAFWAIWQNYSIHKKKMKLDLLNKIVDWALEIQRNSLEVDIPLSGNVPVEGMRFKAEANSLFKYGITFTKNTHISAIASKAFREELESEVEDTIHTFTAFLFLQGTAFGMINAREAFRGTTLPIIDEIEAQIKGDTNKQTQLLKEYEKKIAESANKLLIKAGKTAAGLT